MRTTDQRNRRRYTLEILLVVAICLALAILAWTTGIFKKPPTEHRVTFRVVGGAVVRISYSTSPDDEMTSKEVSTPWEITSTLKSGTEVYLTAANTAQTGEISCILLLDKKAWKKDTARAPSTNVACGGIVP